MNFQLKSLTLAQAATHKTDALVVLVPATLPKDNAALGTLITQAVRAGDLDLSKPGKLLTLWRAPGIVAPRVVLVTLGEGQPKHWRLAVTAAAGAVKSAKPKDMAIVLPSAEAAQVCALALAVADANYVYTATKPSAEASKLKTVTLGVPDAKLAHNALAQAKARVAGITLAREWGNRPANHATPEHLAKVAQSLTRLGPIQCQVMGPREVKRLGMGSFEAVAQGAENALRFIVLRYQGAAKTVAPTVLVGKGITFDTGGISLKPGAGMDEMKFDMCGAASVLGTFRALADLRPAVNVVGLIPACENMPDGRALKPGDVVTSMSGQTIEVLNTDAEGRLILCDALTYAERFKPAAVIDIATLTGACVVALGSVRSGMFATQDDLAQSLLTAGEQSLDLCWRMPLDDEYAEGLKSNFADVANVGDRAAGAVTAAKFLQRFASQFPWAHLDIAGTAWKSGGAKGATGRPVGLLLSYLLGQQAQPTPAKKSVSRRTQA